MSPEDIFASQMWPWPDPALKRDSMGRVLFVNAAFLQMYGGNIDDWRGNIVTGWPAPQAPGTPYRFETRLPTQEGEQVYDWMEYTLADGNAFAMARNVTYLFQPIDPNPGAEAADPTAFVDQPQEASHVPPVSQEPNIPPQQPAFAEAVAEPVMESAIQDTMIDTAPEQPALQSNIPAAIVPAAAAAVAVSAIDPIVEAAQSVQVPDIPPVQDVQVPEFEQALSEITEEAPQVETFAETQNAQMQNTETQDSDRAYERRALPIENEDAVLGNNWRDAVIAKAVGAEPTVAEEEEVAETVDEVAEADTGGAIRILLAEDNAINALLTRTLLEAEGHVVDTVEDGALAVEAMKTSTYDLIFMDMRMPNMDGLEATRKIRAMNNVPKGLPIIALTANAFDDDRNACFDSGMNDFMTKPVSAEELSEMVRTWTKNLAERNAAA